MRQMSSSRRAFLASTAASAGALLLPGCQSGPKPRAPIPADRKVRLMVIGVGGQGAANLQAVAGEEVAILCDVDQQRLDAARERHPLARAVRDYRPILRDPVESAWLDGVVISTPDHTHFLPAALALQQGLGVYCEKPLTHTVRQARQLQQLARQHDCITQMGTQMHAQENYRRVVEAIRAGAIGPVREVLVFVNGTDWSAAVLPPLAEPLPQLDFDLWLGPAAEQPFRSGLHPAGWRRYWAFGGGTTADMGCHFLDLAYWALELDAPTSLLADGPEPHADCAPAGLRCEYAFPPRGARPAVTVRWHGGKDRPTAALEQRGLTAWNNGVLFLGEDGWLIADYTRHELGPAARREVWVPPAPSLPPSPGHHREWLQACRDRTQPSCHFDYAAPLTMTVLLANAAYRGARGQRLSWDARRLRTGVPEVDALLEQPARTGFRV
jgi:predicted dehydrogenase